MWDNPYYQTEFALLKSIGIPIKHKGNMIVECKMFPTYYGGNLLLINKDHDADLEYFETLFDQYFTAPKTKHKTFLLLPESRQYKELIEAARQKKYEITEFKMMAMAPKPSRVILKDNYVIDQIDLLNNSTDIADYLELMKASNDLEWFWTEGFKKQQTVTRMMGIQWFAIREQGKPQILSSLGIFKLGELARMQDVMTHPDHFRNGYATQLLNHAIHFANQELEVKEIVIEADKNDHAYQLYAKLGFQDVFEMTELMKF